MDGGAFTVQAAASHAMLAASKDIAQPVAADATANDCPADTPMLPDLNDDAA